MFLKLLVLVVLFVAFVGGSLLVYEEIEKRLGIFDAKDTVDLGFRRLIILFEKMKASQINQAADSIETTMNKGDSK